MHKYLKSLGRILPFFVLSVFIVSCEKNDVTEVTIDASSKQLTLGQVDSLFADVNYTGNILPSIKWTSSNTAVVTVSNGEISAVTKGSAVITAQAGDKSASCTVTVTDQIHPQMVKGELWYFGDPYDKGISHNFIACIASQKIDLDKLTGDGEFMFLEFNTDLTYTRNIPGGIYTINENFTAGTLFPAWVDDNGSPWGTWLFGKTYNPVESGQAVVETNAGGYTIQYDLLDIFGNTISGSYSGALTYFDYSSSSAAPANFVKQRMINLKPTHSLVFSKRK